MALAAGLKATLADPQFLADVQRGNLEIQPMEPDTIAKLVDDVLRTPAPVVARARVLLGAQNR